MLKKNIGSDGFVWWIGVVEDREDPLKLGRARVRITGEHSQNKEEMPTESLPWAMPVMPLDHGTNVVGPREADWVIGFWMDGPEGQRPVMLGVLPGIPEDVANPKLGFNDPTTDEALQNREVPRPPEYKTEEELENALLGDEEGESVESEEGGRFRNPDELPFTSTGMGVLEKEFDIKNFIFDVDLDQDYDYQDAAILADRLTTDGFVDTAGGIEAEGISYSMSRYPLEPLLKEPISSRLARNENIEQTIIAKKKGGLSIHSGAAFVADDLAVDNVPIDPTEGEPFTEPETPYNAEYKYNHAYSSESGHFVEIDDTPGAERMHWYHRSSTFREFHPDGTLVDKCVASQYNITLDDYYVGVGKNASMDAVENFRIKGGTGVIIESGGPAKVQAAAAVAVKAGSDMALDAGNSSLIRAGNNITQEAGNNINIGAGGNIEVKGDGNIDITAEGNMTIKCEGILFLDAAAIITRAEGFISENSPVIVHQADLTAANGVLTCLELQEGIEVPNPGDAFLALQDIPEVPEEEDAPAEVASAFQPGFLLDAPKTGVLWKPASDSDGKPVSLGPPGAVHTIYEAVPTGELENVTITYLHADQSSTSWNVVRPIHKKGRVIEQPRFSGNANGGRDHYRYSKEASEYPQQFILDVGGEEFFIYDATIRHD